MSPEARLASIRRRLADELSALSARHARAEERTRAQLDADLAAALAPTRVAAERAMAEVTTGRTPNGTEAWRRALAPWEAWDDVGVVPAAGAAVGGALVRVGVVEAAHIGSDAHTVPAVLPLLGRANLLFTTSGSGLQEAAGVARGVLLRLLATVPAGQLRITAVDAGGLGAAFGDLLGLDARVRGPEVHHEERAIGEALTELTAHISTARQRLLRGDHATLAAYNAVAGEVAEPWRVLLVAGFPAGFRPEVAERLLTILRNGPPLGVSVILTVDAAAAPPQGVSLAELERSAVVMRLSRGRWECVTHGLDLTADPPPPHALTTRVVSAWNTAVAVAEDVRVPFGALLPEDAWTGDATEGLVLPLGRRAAGEPLLLRLGQRGTAHHALAGGRTGAGKTVLLHVLIAALAHRYAPDEVGLYLVDFKEGVEFQVYRDLPHARVVAVQSEREFGLSVLEGLRAELNQRGERFRERGVEDLAAWRKLTGEALPRLVLIVDEFQVFFEASDAVAHAARTLLSDLVSRGRSFGIHCVLASQTLSAMDLDARTLSQISVRLALQMSEADSHKVLGRENDAAARLERPGQAVFNDASGATGANVRFQVAFLDRPEREARVAAMRQRRPDLVPVRFEGNRPARLAENPGLVRLLDGLDAAERAGAAPDAEPRAMELWLGAPTSVSDPGGFRLRRQARANLVIVGAEAATASVMLLGAVAAAAAQMPGGTIRLFDLVPGEDALEATLGQVWARLPVRVEVLRADELEAGLAAAHATLRARQAPGQDRGARELLVFRGLQRARGLERAGLKAPPALTQLLQILSEGPDRGLHTLVWADTITALQRVFAPAEIAEFGGRVALSAGDATRVLGPAAASLPTLRRGYAWLAVEDEGDRPHKLRCHGPESATWLATRLAGAPLTREEA